MATKSISRRDILKTLTMGAMAGSVLRVIPAQAAEYAHHMVAAEKAATAAGVRITVAVTVAVRDSNGVVRAVHVMTAAIPARRAVRSSFPKC